MDVLFRVLVDGVPRLARGPLADGPTHLLPATIDLDELLAAGGDALGNALESPSAGAVPDDATLLAPVQGQEVWASGVTFERSRVARNEEAGPVDIYDRVYSAHRPELFAKAAPWRVRGPEQPVGIRADSGWNVPEPELGLVADTSGRLVAYTVGNDVSSRSIEGENPLYLPQAKVYTGSCALGPALVPAAQVGPLSTLTVELEIRRDGAPLFADSVSLADLRRTPEELLGWLFRALDFPVGAVLLTGTSIVPPPEFTLAAGDVVTISIAGIGTLVNPVEVVGTPVPA
ncbi:fumarylacetoacetate hydrolase family protein [Planosporangium mesophilum]|uniref:2-hydroxyhepta-2,4-diene-1,7-dioate isomerase n=1 Tax=Planosporangium mesophilum TaxID=689768 RepID=A0A8J3WZW6_9ACTN|nr:fumarylacetoacetate hydrolase family protein [Planosporangium mesophilum]NJC83989.1 fumarylacetoacetate hydrolase [Planosporangium mesophilum]GII22642.1 2-hydroxyhepta-2,4-diene-1,7-dioate isomerase [Planosporangium mesophilum]